MPSINLGKVVGDKGTSLRYRGKWNAAAQYINDGHFIDLVAHQGSLWTCLVTNSSTEPGTGGPEWDVSVTGGASVANDLLQTAEGHVLDARQGKVLDDKKVDKDRIVQSTTITETGFVMDGKTIADAIAEINNKLDVSRGGILRLGNTLIQWGGASTANTNAVKTIAFKEEYDNTSYFVSYNWIHNANLVIKSWLGDAGGSDARTTTGCGIYVNRTASNYASYLTYIVIGAAKL